MSPRMLSRAGRRSPMRRAPGRAPFALLLVVVAACCGSGDSGLDPAASDSAAVYGTLVSVLPDPLLIRQGLSGTATVTLTRNGDSKAPMTLAVSGQPDGVTVTLDPSTLGPSQLSSKVTVSTPPGATIGNWMLGITLSVGATSAERAQFGLGVYAPRVIVTRAGTGSGTVTSSPAGIDCGQLCAAGFPAQSTVTLTAKPAAGSVFTGWSGACSGTAATCTLTSFVGANVIATFDSGAPGFTFAVAPTQVSVQQGGAGAARVSIARTNGFAGAVALGVSGVPSGLTITPSPASVPDTVSTLNIAAAPSLAAGSYPITITANAAGLAQQTAPMTVQVTPAPAGNGSVAFDYARCDPTEVPIWFAVQNGGGAWTRVNAGAGNVFAFTIGAAGTGLAYVTRSGTELRTTVLYGSASDIVAMATGNQCAGITEPPTGTKQVSVTLGSAGGPGQSNFNTVVIGGASATHYPAQGASFPVTGVPAGTRDLIATRTVLNQNGNGTNIVQRLILRRDVAYANNANVPLLELGGTEAVSPAPRFYLLPNLGADHASIGVALLTANGATAPYDTTSGFFAPARNAEALGYQPIPDSLLRPGDFHLIQISAMASNDAPSARFILLLRHSADTTAPNIDFGPSPATATVTSLASAPYLRLRTQLPSQSAYGAATFVDFEQPDHTVSIAATARYLGGTPSRWTIDIPDLSSAGYDPTWGLRSGTSVSWLTAAVGGDVLSILGAQPTGDQQALVGISASSSSGFDRARSSLGARWLRRP